MKKISKTQPEEFLHKRLHSGSIGTVKFLKGTQISEIRYNNTENKNTILKSAYKLNIN